MRLPARLLVFCLGLAVPLMGQASPQPKVVQPGQILSNQYLNVRVPQGQGWQLAGQSPTIVSFLKPGKDAGETYLAQVTLFPLAGAKGKAAFMRYIRKGIEQDTPADLFHPVRSDLVYSGDRGYICARYTGLTEDHSKPAQGTLLLQVESLYCQHPADGRIGFVVTYMHRGKAVDKALGPRAKSFIEGVQVNSSDGH